MCLCICAPADAPPAQLYVGTKQHYEHKIDPNKAHKYVFRVRGRTDHGWQDWSEGFSYFTHVSNESDLPSFSSSSAQQTKSDTPWSFDNNMKGSHIKFSNSSHTATSTDAYQSVAVSQWIRRVRARCSSLAVCAYTSFSLD